MASCYNCGAHVPPGGGCRRTVWTGRSSRFYIGRRVSSSHQNSYGPRTVCVSCAKAIDRSNSIMLLAVIILVIIVVIASKFATTTKSTEPTNESVSGNTFTPVMPKIEKPIERREKFTSATDRLQYPELTTIDKTPEVIPWIPRSQIAADNARATPDAVATAPNAQLPPQMPQSPPLNTATSSPSRIDANQPTHQERLDAAKAKCLEHLQSLPEFKTARTVAESAERRLNELRASRPPGDLELAAASTEWMKANLRVNGLRDSALLNDPEVVAAKNELNREAATKKVQKPETTPMKTDTKAPKKPQTPVRK